MSHGELGRCGRHAGGEVPLGVLHAHEEPELHLPARLARLVRMQHHLLAEELDDRRVAAVRALTVLQVIVAALCVEALAPLQARLHRAPARQLVGKVAVQRIPVKHTEGTGSV